MEGTLVLLKYMTIDPVYIDMDLTLMSCRKIPVQEAKPVMH